MQFLPFQKKAAQTIVEKFNGRSLVALEMGLGKSAIAIEIAKFYLVDSLVIICPASLRLNWLKELLLWNYCERKDIQILKTSKDTINFDSKVFILSYELATTRCLDIAILKPEMIILDESHYVKNKTAKRTKSIVPLCRAAQRCLLLSGTPILNRPIELWAQLEALNVSFGSYWTFAKRYCNARRGRFGWDVSGASNVQELNQRLSKQVMVRYKKDDVLTQLPAKTRTKLLIQGSGKTKEHTKLVKLCEQALKKSNNNVELALQYLKSKKVEIDSCLFTAYVELAELKTKEACDIILEQCQQVPLVVFAHHKVMLNAISQTLNDNNIKFGYIDGGTKLEDRQKSVDDFQNGQTNVIVLSIMAASTGITLTRSSNMLITELPFSPAVALQAEDRIHRIGQHAPVQIQYLVAENTLDDSLWRFLTDKNRLQSNILDDKNTSAFNKTNTEQLGTYWEAVREILSSCVNDKQIDLFN